MRTLVGKVLLIQVCITLLAMIVAMCFFDVKSVKAAGVAGFVAVVPAIAYARFVARIQPATPSGTQLLLNALGEMTKLLLTLVLLGAVFFGLKNELSMTYFIAAYIACLMSYGIALVFK